MISRFRGLWWFGGLYLASVAAFTFAILMIRAVLWLIT